MPGTFRKAWHRAATVRQRWVGSTPNSQRRAAALSSDSWGTPVPDQQPPFRAAFHVRSDGSSLLPAGSGRQCVSRSFSATSSAGSRACPNARVPGPARFAPIALTPIYLNRLVFCPPEPSGRQRSSRGYLSGLTLHARSASRRLTAVCRLFLLLRPAQRDENRRNPRFKRREKHKRSIRIFLSSPAPEWPSRLSAVEPGRRQSSAECRRKATPPGMPGNG